MLLFIYWILCWTGHPIYLLYSLYAYDHLSFAFSLLLMSLYLILPIILLVFFGYVTACGSQFPDQGLNLALTLESTES